MSDAEDILGTDSAESEIEEAAKHFRECAECRKAMIEKYRWPAKAALVAHEAKLGRTLNAAERAAFAAATVNLASYVSAAEVLQQKAVMAVVGKLMEKVESGEKRDPTALSAAVHAGFGKQNPGEA